MAEYSNEQGNNKKIWRLRFDREEDKGNGNLPPRAVVLNHPFERKEYSDEKKATELSETPTRDDRQKAADEYKV